MNRHHLLAKWPLSQLSCLVLALTASSAWATEGPPIEIRMPPDTVMAVSGKPYKGVFEIELYRPGVLNHVDLAGPGWKVDSVDRPPSDQVLPIGVVRIPFTATPDDANQPLGLSVTFNGRHASQRYVVGPEYFDHRGKGSASTLIPNTSALPATVTSGAGCDCPSGGGPMVRGVGRIVFTRPDGQLVGAHRVRVELRDEDPVGHEVLWFGFTDENGYFDSGCLGADVDGDGSGPDLVVFYETDNGLVDVTDNSITEDTYWAATDEITDFRGTCFDFGWIMPVSGAMENAMHILTTVTRAWYYLENIQGYGPGSVQVEWPVEAWTHYERGPEEIHLNELHQWEEVVMIHEYGHHFLGYYGDPPATAYCNNICDDDPPDDCGHCVWCAETDHDAFNEGFPNWLGDVITRSFAVDYEFEPGIPYEPFIVDWGVETESPRMCGELDPNDFDDPIETEGFIGLMLRDMEDDTADDHDPNDVFDAFDAMCIGAEPILTTVIFDGPTTIQEFFNGFSNRYPEHIGALWPTAANVGGIAYTSMFPADNEPPGVVAALSSSSHPSGIGGSLPCITFEFTPAFDNITGATKYSYLATQNPSGEEPNEVENVIRPLDGCALQGVAHAGDLGPWYISIKARDNAGQWSSGFATFGPFDVIDCNNTGQLDICDISCTMSDLPGLCDFGLSPCTGIDSCIETSADCNDNFKPDECDIDDGTSEDCNLDGVPDECQPVKHWSGEGNNQDWTNPLNWAENQVPQDGDHVCIAPTSPTEIAYQSGQTELETLACQDSLDIHDGSNPFPPYSFLTLHGPSFVNGQLEMRGASTLTVNDSLTLNGLFRCGNSTLNGTGYTEVLNGMTLTGSVTLNNHDLIASHGDIFSSQGTFSVNSGSLLHIKQGVTYRYEGDYNVAIGSTNGLIDNDGTIESDPSDDLVGIGVPIDNAGTIHAIAGELGLNSASTNTGQVLAASDATISFASALGGDHEFLPSSTFDVGSVKGNSGDVDFHGQVNILDTLHVAGSIVTFHPDADVESYGQHIIADRGILNIEATVDDPFELQSVLITTQGESAGLIDFSSGQLVSVDSFTMVTGTLEGPSPIQVNGPLSWTNGTFWYGGDITANGLVTFNATNNNRSILRVLNITNQATILSGFGMSSPGRVNILDDAIVFLQFNSGGIGGGILSNDGTVLRTSGDGNVSITSTVINNGLIHNQTGMMSFTGTNTHNDTLRSDVGTTLRVGGNATFPIGSHLEAHDVILGGIAASGNHGNVNITGTMTFDGTWEFFSDANIISYGPDVIATGQAMFDAPPGLPLEFDSVTLGISNNHGVIHFNTGEEVNVDSMILNSGTLEGPSPVHVGNVFEWRNGTLGFGAGVHLYGESSVFPTSSQRTTYRNMHNAGNFTFLGGAITLGSGRVFTNLPDGVLDIRGNAAFASSEFQNEGVLLKTTGVDAARFVGCDILNSGVVDIRMGDIEMQSAAFTQTAGQTILNGGNLRMNPIAEPIRIEGGTLMGISSAQGNVIVDGGMVSPGLSAGALTVEGDYMQASAGSLDIEIGGTAEGEFDSLVVSGAADLGGTLLVTDIDGFIASGGEEFVVLSATSVNGVFDSLAVPPHYEVDYTPTQVVVRAITASADLNGDGFIDLRDFRELQTCFQGDGMPASPECGPRINADLDLDGDVDLDDYALFQEAAQGG